MIPDLTKWDAMDTTTPPDLTPAEIAILRESMGWTPAQLAGLWGVAEYSIRRWESGKNPMPLALQQNLLLMRQAFEEQASNAARQLATSPAPTLTVERRTTKGPFPTGWKHALAMEVARLTPGLTIQWKDETK